MIITSHTISPGPLQTQLPRKTERANLESKAGALVEATLTHTEVIEQNLASAVSPIDNKEAARAMIQLARKQFLAQPEIAMLAQANHLPQNALRLLQ